jgi:IS30 family transposase
MGKQYLLFFAHPYRSGERGANENSNGIIRRFFPKGTDFANVSEWEIAKAQTRMNRYPRKILNGLPPVKLFPLRLLA